MSTIATLNEDFIVDDALLGHSPAGEVVGPGQETPPAVRHDLSSFTAGVDVPQVQPHYEPAVQADHYPTTLSDLTPPRAGTNQWDPRFLLDLAVGVDSLPEILDRYALSSDAFDTLSRTQAFRRELAMTIRDVRENGVSFTQKARVQAESYLEVIDQLVYDFNTPASTRLESIRSMVRWGRLEPPKEDKEGAGVNASQININISF